MSSKPRAYEYAGLVGNYVLATHPGDVMDDTTVAFDARCVQIEDTPEGVLFHGADGSSFMLHAGIKDVTRFSIWAPSFTESGHPTSIRRFGTSTGRLRTSGPPEYWQDMRPDA